MLSTAADISKHFLVQPLAEDTFAAIATIGGSAICNAGLMDLGEQIVVFDTFLTPQAARDLRQYAIDRFAQTPQVVVNSHYHNDHIWGNQVFAATAQILSSSRTRALIATAGMEEYQFYSAHSAQKLERLRAQYDRTTDQEQRRQLLLWIGEYAGVVETLPYLKVHKPAITFEDRLKIYGARRTAELFTFEGGHTASDTVLYLPQDGIVFMSDLLFTGCHPYLGDGDPDCLLAALRELSRLDVQHFVPGHGAVGTLVDMKILIEYIEGCLETARSLVDQGIASDEAITGLKIPAGFQDWLAPEFYPANIRFLYERLSPLEEMKAQA